LLSAHVCRERCFGIHSSQKVRQADVRGRQFVCEYPRTLEADWTNFCIDDDRANASRAEQTRLGQRVVYGSPPASATFARPSETSTSVGVTARWPAAARCWTTAPARLRANANGVRPPVGSTRRRRDAS